MSPQNIQPEDAARPPRLADAAEEARLEAEAIRDLERMQRALNAKKSGYKPWRRRAYADHR